MNESKKLKLIDSVLNYIPVLLSFLVPMWFLPITVEFFEFNKLTLVTISTVIMLVVWAAKIAITRQVVIAKSKVDLGIAAFVLVLILSTVFSIHKTSSLFGSAGRWYPSLFGIISVVIYYYITASNLSASNVKKALLGLLAGSTISSVVSTLAYYNVFLGSTPYLSTQAFSLTGSTLTALLLAIVASVIAFGSIPTTKNIVLKSVYALVGLLNVFFVMVVREYSFIGLWAVSMIALVLYSGVSKIKENLMHYAVVAAGVVLSAIILFVPAFSKITNNENFPRPVVLPAAQSWMIASSTIREMPLLGSGPSTFYLMFPKYRTVDMNYTDFWTFRFDKPFNEMFNVLSTMGILGFAAYLLLNMKVLKLGWDTLDKNENNHLAIAQAAMITMVFAGVVTYSTVVSDFLLFTLIAMVVALKAGSSNNGSMDQSVASLTNWSQNTAGGNVAKKEYLHLIAITPVLGLAAVGAFLNYKTYAGEFYMRQALDAAVVNDANKAYKAMSMAIQQNPQMESYHNTFAQTNLALANALAGKKDLSDDDKKNIQLLISQAITSSKVASEAVNPLSVSAWETRAGIYRAILNIAKDSADWAVQAYTNAISLDQTNPLLRIQLGGIYYANGKYLEAANQFRNATALKKDYANAWYNFAQALVQLKDYKNAQTSLEVVQKLVKPDSEDAKKVAEELAQVKSMADAQAATNKTAQGTDKPTVDQLTAPTAPSNTPQQPLTNPAQSADTVKTNSTAPVKTDVVNN